MPNRTLTTAMILASALWSAGCGSEETGPEEGGHTPEDAALYVMGGAELTPDVTLAAGQVIEVEVLFLDHDGEEITEIEDHHYAKLTFAPEALATIAPIAGRHFAFEVTVQGGAGVGTVTIGYGHDEEADELSFGPFEVTVQ